MTVKLCFESYPDLAKQDTLFVHGNLASSVWWEPACEEWRKLGSLGSGRLILADWRGCGQNPEWPKGDSFSIEQLAQDHLELLDQLESPTTALVGHSLGGLICLQMMILAPGRFSRAVLLDPVGATGVVFDDSMYDAFRMMAADPELTRNVILSTVHGADRLSEEFTSLIARDAFKAVGGIGTSVLEILKTVDLNEAARGVQTPTLVLHGAHDAVIPLQDARTLAELLPHSTLEVLPDAGHCWNIEEPAKFTARLRDWL